MPIKKIIIKNYKSIKKCSIDISNINALIGENGTGKSNILSAISYFYKNLLSNNISLNIFDKNNKFINKVEISIVYDLSNIKKRATHNLNLNDESKYSKYYDYLLNMNDVEVLTFSQLKDGNCSWNRTFNIREAIFYLFPLYYIDAREIELTDWRDLWAHVGDLIKLESNLSNNLKEQLSNIILLDKYKLSDKFKKIQMALLDSNITIKHFTPKEFATNISEIQLLGTTFNLNENKLEYSSNGTNAFNYINLLLNILKLISDFKMKEPYVIIDEPEISLHHNLIDELALKLLRFSKDLSITISTHSPRLIKFLLKYENNKCNIFHVIMYNGYTSISKMKLFSENEQRSRNIITDQHANAYFAKKVLMVEGESELELFSNIYLMTLFPIIKKTEIIKGMSDNVVKDIVFPQKRNYSTPIISLIDMDKVIEWHQNINQFRLAKDSQLSTNKYENYYYTQRRYATLYLKKRIISMMSKCKFHYRYPFFECSDESFLTLIHCIKQYLRQYNIFVAKTTIEGMLINDNVINLFWDFTQERYGARASWNECKEIYLKLNKKDRLNFLRLLYNGKSDYILNFKKIQDANKKISIDIINAINKNRVNKTSGWISDWLEYYICNKLLVVPFKSETFDDIINKLKDYKKLQNIVNLFKEDFYELYDLITML